MELSDTAPVLCATAIVGSSDASLGVPAALDADPVGPVGMHGNVPPGARVGPR
jgi:hypothetical protein